MRLTIRWGWILQMFLLCSLVAEQMGERGMTEDQRKAIEELRDWIVVNRVECPWREAPNAPPVANWPAYLAALDALLAEVEWLRIAAPGAAEKFDCGQAMTIHGTV